MQHSQPELNTRVAIYARVSTDEQREGHTINSQITELERFVHANHWTLTEIYKDEGWSGGILARPELDRLRDDAAKKLFGTVVLNDVDRLARDVTHLGVIKKDLERHGVRVVFRKLPAESSPTHNLMVNILGSFAEFERELIADRTRRGKRHKVEVRKQYLGAIAPYGFRYFPGGPNEEGRLEINPQEADVIRQMFEWVDAEGLSARKVLQRLDSLGIRPRHNGPRWGRSSVNRILRSEVYSGIWHYYKHENCEPKRTSKSVKYRKCVKSSNRRRPKTDWLPVALPTSLILVSRDRWQRVQTQLDRNITFSPRNTKHFYLLSGLIKCGGCGAAYVGDPVHGRFFYRCSKRCKLRPSINEAALNAVVWRCIERAMLNPELITTQLEKLQHRRLDVSSLNASLGEMTNAFKQIDSEESRLLEAYRLGILSPAQLATELERLNQRRVPLTARRAELEQELADRAAPTAGPKPISAYCKAAAARMKTFTLEERRHFLRLLIRTIVFDGSSTRIRGAIPLEAFKAPAGANEQSSGDSRIETTALGDRGHNPPGLSRIANTLFEIRGRNPVDWVRFEIIDTVRSGSRTPGVVTGGKRTSHVSTV